MMKTASSVLSVMVVLFSVMALTSCQASSDPAAGDVIGKLPVPDAIKNHDPQLDDALGKLVVKVAFDGQVNTKTEKPYTQTTVDSKFYSWKACVRLPIFNVTCIEPYVSVNDLTMGVRLTSDGTVLLSKSSPGTAECVNDAKPRPRDADTRTSALQTPSRPRHSPRWLSACAGDERVCETAELPGNKDKLHRLCCFYCERGLLERKMCVSDNCASGLLQLAFLLERRQTGDQSWSVEKTQKPPPCPKKQEISRLSP